MSKVQVMDHPLIQHKSELYPQKKKLVPRSSVRLLGRLRLLCVMRQQRDLKLQDVEIETPICKMVGKELSGKKLAVVPILRAGLGMVDGMLSMIPAAKVGHIGLYRDPETYEPVEYYCKLPADCDEREVFVVDPMLANRRFKRSSNSDVEGKRCRNIFVSMCIIAAPEGVERMQKEHPDVDIYIGALDENSTSISILFRDLVMLEIVFSGTK